MKINRKLLPLKAHYFCFLGCMSPILPFIIVVALQLGVPVSIQGPLSAATLLVTVVGKPLVAALADSFPTARKAIFLITITFMVSCYSSIRFIQPMQETPNVSGQLVKAVKASGPSGGAENEKDLQDTEHSYLLAHDEGECYVAMAWDCVALCSHPWACLNGNNTSSGIKVTALEDDHGLQVVPLQSQGTMEDFLQGDSLDASLLDGFVIWNSSAAQSGTSSIPPRGRLYQLEGVDVPWNLALGNVSLECIGGNWKGDTCLPAWSYWQFWIYVLLLMVGQISFNTCNSITDAITVDSVGVEGDYGVQRAWGTVGWGLMGPISGLLIDWWSGSSVNKDYTPAFILCFLLGSCDIFLSAASLKVPKIKTEQNILKNLGPLLRHPRFFIFCCFVIMNGAFDGVVANYIFIMQESMAKGTEAMKYMKFIQGSTLFVQCAIEAPFMFVYSWFLKRMGAQQVTSLVFFLYIFRLLGLSAVGAYGPVWGTLLVEFLNGPCYGLGYTAIVVYAAKISPPGTSNTVQSVVNICYESFGYALAMFAGGVLFAALGGPRMYLVAGITSCVVFVLHLLSLKFLPPPEEASVNGDVQQPKEAAKTDEEEEEQMALNTDEAIESIHRSSIESAGRDDESIELQMNHSKA